METSPRSVRIPIPSLFNFESPLFYKWISGILPELCLVWGYSSVGRAPALQAGGQEFESLYLHHTIKSCTLKTI